MSKTFIKTMFVESWVLENGGRSANNLHQNSFPLGMFLYSLSLYLLVLINSLLLCPFMFNLYEESSLDQMVTV